MIAERDDSRVSRTTMFEVLLDQCGTSRLAASFRYASDAYRFALGEMASVVYLRRTSDKLVLRDLADKTLRQVREWSELPPYGSPAWVHMEAQITARIIPGHGR